MRVGDLDAVNRFTFVPARCPICEIDDARPRHVITKYAQGELTFVTCNRCGTVYQNPCPDAASMQNFYLSQNFFSASRGSGKLVGYLDYDAEEQTRQRNAAYRLKEVESFFPAGTRLKILKVACGYGTFVKGALDAGHDATGLDASKAMVDGARERYGIELIHSPFLDHDFGAERFDAVLLYGAITNFHDVTRVGRRINDILKPGGLYLSNFVEPDSLLERIQGPKFWLYRPPVIGLWSADAFIAEHKKFGMELSARYSDVQWASLGKLAGHVQIEWVGRGLRALRLYERHIRVPPFGSVKVVLRRPHTSGRR
jgi:SAM-dependent methyltransferase